MRMVDLIDKKKRGGQLSEEEIAFFVEGFSKGTIPDYQAAALLMAICWQGMDKKETVALTMAYIDSGERLDLSGIEGKKVDKHSTGGVGDKVSLIIIPLLAAAGVPVAKLSGRGLGHTGGTIDKLESIPGFRTQLTVDEFIANVNKHKMAIMGQSADLTPADKLIYALRDVTATVDSIPLIAASVMSKKIAAGAEAIVLDIKTGAGSFMKTLGKAEELAEIMIKIGQSLNKDVLAVITDMSQPLGREIGNANEVMEAIEVLRGEGPPDVVEVSLTIAAHMAVLGGAFRSFAEGYKGLEQIIRDGSGLAKFKELVILHGGDERVIDHPELLFPPDLNKIEISAESTGYIAAINAEMIGLAAMHLGAGRREKEDQIDHAAGITLIKKGGDPVDKDDIIAVLRTHNTDYQEAAELVRNAYTFTKTPPPPPIYVKRTMSSTRGSKSATQLEK